MTYKPFLVSINLSQLNELSKKNYLPAKDLEILKDLSNYYKFALRCPSCKQLFGLDRVTPGMSPFCPECLSKHHYKDSIITKLKGMKGGFRLTE